MEKLGQNLLKTASFRPLSMLNTDYKISAKILANRLQMVLTYLIDKQQVGFMKGRVISTNLAELLTVIDYCSQDNVEAIITSINFRKSFDTVSWEAMQAIMRKFGFPQKSIDMTMLCYRDFYVNIGNSGHFSERFAIQRGNKQGCPLSALQFLLVVETVGLKRRQDPHIEPITINGIKKLLSQYADDLWTATKLSQQSFDAQLQIFDEFHKFTGLAINYNKTEVMRIGASEGSNAKLYSKLPLIWSDGPIKVLGIHFVPTTQKTVDYNYKSKLEKIENIFKLWSYRSLSLVGKILVINTLAIAQMIYCLQCLPSPTKAILDKYDKLVRSYLWSGKKSKVSLKRLQATYKRGGLKLVNFKIKDHSIKFATFVRLCLNEDKGSMICPTLCAEMMNMPKGMLSQTNFSVTDVLSNFKKNGSAYVFLQHITAAWAQHNYIEPNYCEEVLAQPLWYNSNIKIINRVCKPKGILDNEPKVVGDLMSHNNFESLSLETLKQTFPHTQLNFLDLMAIQAAIPRLWKRMLKLQGPQKSKLPLHNSKILAQGSVSRWAYFKTLNAEPRIDDKYRSKWEQLLDVEILDRNWEEVMNIVMSITLSTKLRPFQYRLLNFAVIANIQLQKWNLRPTVNCSFCNSEKEDYVHLFVSCKTVVKKVWKPLLTWLNYFCFIELPLDKYQILLNHYKDSFKDMVNTIILITKHYIYAKRCLE